MFDIDQDEEILALVQAAYIFRNRHMLPEYVSVTTLVLKLDTALKEVEKKYGHEIFTHTLPEPAKRA